MERIFLGPLDPWIAAGAFFDNKHKVSGTVMPAAATNNLLLDLAVVRRHGLRFDNRFGLIGGGDERFFVVVERLAVALEPLPPRTSATAQELANAPCI